MAILRGESLPTARAVRYLQISANANRDNHSTGGMVDFLRLCRRKVRFHAKAILQRIQQSPCNAAALR
jgi:hypothetical protein